MTLVQNLATGAVYLGRERWSGAVPVLLVCGDVVAREGRTRDGRDYTGEWEPEPGWAVIETRQEIEALGLTDVVLAVRPAKGRAA